MPFQIKKSIIFLFSTTVFYQTKPTDTPQHPLRCFFSSNEIPCRSTNNNKLDLDTLKLKIEFYNPKNTSPTLSIAIPIDSPFSTETTFSSGFVSIKNIDPHLSAIAHAIKQPESFALRKEKVTKLFKQEAKEEILKIKKGAPTTKIGQFWYSVQNKKEFDTEKIENLKTMYCIYAQKEQLTALLYACNKKQTPLLSDLAQIIYPYIG